MPKISREELVELYANQKLSLLEIARQYGYANESCVAYIRDSYGMPPRSRGEIKKGKHCSPSTEFRKGLVPWNKGLTKDNDSRLAACSEMMPLRQSRQSLSGKHRKNISRALKGGTHKDTKYRLTKQQYDKLYYQEKMSLAEIASTLGCSASVVRYWLEKHGIPTRDNSTAGKLTFSKNPPSSRHRHSKELYERLYCQERLSCATIARQLGSNPETVRYWLEKYNIPRRNNIQASRIKPTEPELRLTEIIERHDLPFEYVGDGKVILEGLCPDFINVNGEKQVIEVFGDYWHTGAVKNWRQFEGGRIHHYAKFGFKTLILWENELENERAVVKKIKKFNQSLKGCSNG